MKMTKKDALRYLADPTDTIYRKLLRNGAVEAWNGTSINASLAEIRLSSDDWKKAGNHVIKNGTDKDLVDLFFLLAEAQGLLARVVKHLDKIKNAYETATGTEDQ